MNVLASFLPLAAIGISAPGADQSEQLEKIALAVSSVQTCEQLGYSVDRAALLDWTRSAQQDAIASGQSEAEARTALEEAVNARHAADYERFADAKRMQHSEELVARNNQLWRSRCRGLSHDPLTAAYFAAAED